MEALSLISRRKLWSVFFTLFLLPSGGKVLPFHRSQVGVLAMSMPITPVHPRLPPLPTTDREDLSSKSHCECVSQVLLRQQMACPKAAFLPPFLSGCCERRGALAHRIVL